mmetsp:Transcript_38847/g.87308  ORF Transcript_38847/g.87308 Transcript_38847/m.87308 type:complete len:231 (-) Transcript_38847:55-747(-)
MSVCVRPPPKFPQPPAVALAVPTTALLKRMEFQNWFTTKVEPRAETKKRTAMRPVPFEIVVLMATTAAPKRRRPQSVFTGPKRSITEPRMKRMKTSKETEAIFALAMVCLQPFLHTHSAFSMSNCTSALLSQSPMSLRTTVIKGANANHPMKANMKARVAAQNARMCGFVLRRFPQWGTGIGPSILKGLNSVHLLFSSTGTSNSTVIDIVKKDTKIGLYSDLRMRIECAL